MIELKGIYKSYASTQALNNIYFNFKIGEIRGLCGENGAGKSTLAKILCGDILADKGSFLIDGDEIISFSPHEAQSKGLSIVHQWGNLSMNLTVRENIFLGHELTKKSGALDFTKMNRTCKNLLDKLGLDIRPEVPTYRLSASNQQLVSIAKALSYENVKYLILDEGGVSLDAESLEKLHSVLRILKDSGVGILYISHLLDNVLSLCNEITILRNGELVANVEAEKTSVGELATLVAGHEMERSSKKDISQIMEEEILRTENLKWNPEQSGLNFNIKAKEIVGITGPAGAGKSEFLRTVFGLQPSISGNVYIKNHEIKLGNPVKMVRMGIAFTPEDRFAEGMAYCRSINENAVISDLWRHGFILPFLKLRKQVNEICDILKVKYGRKTDSISTLSGGNQQKIVIGKWLNGGYKCFLFDEPYKGVDIGAKGDINQAISDLAFKGGAVVVASTEFSDLLEVVDRLIVMVNGKMVAELRDSQINNRTILEYYQSVS